MTVALIGCWLFPASFIAAQPRVEAAESPFLDGLAALHSFEYEDANTAFLRAEREAPEFALAYWGEAMTYHQTLWGKEDVAAGRRALMRYGPTAAARARRAASPRERGLLDAVDALFGDGDAATRRRRYADRMAALHAANPDDREMATFYALALLGTMSRSLIGYVDSHEGHSASLAGSDTQRRVGDILGRVLAAHPDHPGALHYVLHNYDDPEHARLGLDAARAYARVAPESSHALHMPAHIFLQLGRWTEAESSDRAAYAASAAWVARQGLPPAMRSYHALAWRQYELLQLGRVQEAAALLDELAPVVTATGDLTLLSDLASMRARQVVESRRWDRMANERNFANVNELCAIGFSAARSGNAALAELARQGLANRATSPQEGDLRPAIAIMEREVAALMAVAAGRREDALDILRAATRDELALPAPLGLPIPIIPAPELLGEVLLEAGRPADAREAFTRALTRNPNRSQSVLGLARASARLGDADGARRHYQQVLDNFSGADADLPDLADVRAALSAMDTAPPATGAPGPTRPIAFGAVGLAALAGFAWATRRYRLRRATSAETRRATPPSQPAPPPPPTPVVGTSRPARTRRRKQR